MNKYAGGEEADISEASRSPAARTRDAKDKPRKKTKVDSRPQKSSVIHSTVSTDFKPEEVVAGTADDTEPVMTGLEKLPGVRFPPALLAANPGLAGAKPGSLVVVASPSKVNIQIFILFCFKRD